MLEFQSSILEEFRWHSRGKHLKSQWNFDRISLECHRNTAADFVQIYRMFSRIILMKYHSFFWRKEPEFLWNFCGTLMEFLWYFLEFGWYFDGILVVFRLNSSQKSNAKGLTRRI